MGAPTVTFFFEIASTYSYLSVMTADAEAEARGVSLIWRPFLLGPIFRAIHGVMDSPFNAQPEKGRYMWRDVERRATRLGLPFRRPSTFPRNLLLAARVSCGALRELSGKEVVRAIYRANFAEGRDIADEATLRAIVAEAGADPDRLLEAARSEAIKAELRANTEEARVLGIFGAPSFVVGEELYWGSDRLHDALDHALGV